MKNKAKISRKLVGEIHISWNVPKGTKRLQYRERILIIDETTSLTPIIVRRIYICKKQQILDHIRGGY